MWGALAAAFVLGSSSAAATPPSRIVFASSRTGVSQLYSVEPSGKGLAQLTFGAGGWQQRLPSPNGRFVAALRQSELWVMRADGSGARLAATNVDYVAENPNFTALSWSGNSRRLAYRGSDWNIWTVAAAGGLPLRLTRGHDAAWPSLSPDGRSVAFVHYGKPGVRLVVLRNRHEHVVARGVNGLPLWSPDGKSIAIRDVAELDVYRPMGRRQSTFPLTRTPTCFTDCLPPALAWSRDSRRLAYVDIDGIHVVRRSGSEVRQLLVKGPVQALAFSPAGNALAFASTNGIKTATFKGRIRMLVPFGPGEAQPGVGWSPAPPGLSYQPPEDAALLVRVSPRELAARVPITKLSADGDRVAYWLCPHSFGAWRPGEAPVALGPANLAACRIPTNPLAPGSFVYDLALAGNRLAYLTRSGSNTSVWYLKLTTLERRDEGVTIVTGAQTNGDESRWAQLEDVVAGGSMLVFGERGLSVLDRRLPESIWRLDDATPALVARRSSDLRPLSVDDGRIVALRADGALDLLDVEGGVLRTFDVQALGAALAGDDLAVLVQGELRDYSASTGKLLYVWPLPDVPSAGRCRLDGCSGVQLTLDDAARGVVVYTLDGRVHLFRLRDGEDKTVPGVKAAELTDAGLFYAFTVDEPWPGRIRFVPFDELPL